MASSIEADNNKDSRTLNAKSKLILEDPLGNKFSEYSQNLARFLITLKKPIDISRVEFHVLKREAIKYSVQD